MVLFYTLALTGLPPNASQVGSIEIVLYLDEDGIGTAFGYEGISKEAALGHMLVVMDRIRKEREYEWATCPDCKRPWAEHFDSDDEDEEDDE